MTLRDVDQPADPELVDDHAEGVAPRGLLQRHDDGAAVLQLLEVAAQPRLVVNGTVLGPGSYCHVPGGEPMHHAPGDGEPCLFVTMFDGPLDAEPLPD